MSTPEIAGMFINSKDGVMYSVLVDFGPNDEIDHVYITTERHQFGDFPFNQPTEGCKLCAAAQALLNLSVPPQEEFDEEFEVIDQGDRICK